MSDEVVKEVVLMPMPTATEELRDLFAAPIDKRTKVRFRQIVERAAQTNEILDLEFQVLAQSVRQYFANVSTKCPECGK
jgi:hypothetical protein